MRWCKLARAFFKSLILKYVSNFSESVVNESSDLGYVTNEAQSLMRDFLDSERNTTAEVRASGTFRFK